MCYTDNTLGIIQNICIENTCEELVLTSLAHALALNII